jgi:hypothetical protein
VTHQVFEQLEFPRLQLGWVSRARRVARQKVRRSDDAAATAAQDLSSCQLQRKIIGRAVTHDEQGNGRLLFPLSRMKRGGGLRWCGYWHIARTEDYVAAADTAFVGATA